MHQHRLRRTVQAVIFTGILLSVHCATSEDITRAKDILKLTGAADIASTGEKSVGAYATTASDSRKM